MNGILDYTLMSFLCEFSTLGTWILACCMWRNYDGAGRINLRLLYELIARLVTEPSQVVFKYILIHGETWLCGHGCDSCLRAILRQVDLNRQRRMSWILVLGSPE